MSTIQISVRIPDDLVEFVDHQVRIGEMPSRAAALTRALRREQRRVIAERDVAILKKASRDDDDDFAGLAEYAASVKLNDLD